MTTRRRRWWWLLLPIALGALAFFGARALLQPERVSRFLLQQAEQLTGLRFNLATPADIGLWPDLHIELEGLSVHAPQYTPALLHVQRVEVALPWSALSGETLTLKGLRLIEPSLDIAALTTYLARRDRTGPPAPFTLPASTAPLEIIQGSIHAESWSLTSVDITLDQLRENQPSTLDLTAAFATGDATPSRFAARLQTTPRLDPQGSLLLDPLVITAALDLLPEWRPHLQSHVYWHPAGWLDLQLNTIITPWPSTWPNPPWPASATPEEITLVLRYQGPTAISGELDIALTQGQEGFLGQLTLNDTLTWLGAENRSLLPPLSGELNAPRLQYNGLEASGVRIRLSPNSEKPAQ